jgi:hypothetical protein
LADQANPQIPQKLEGQISPADMTAEEGSIARQLVRKQRAEQLDTKNAPSAGPLRQVGHATSSNATPNKHRQNITEPKSPSAPSPASLTTAQSRGGEILKATWGAVSRTLQGVCKKEPDQPVENRTTRGGTIIVVAFALTASSLMLGWRHHESTRPTLNDGMDVSAQVSADSSLTSASLLYSLDSNTINGTPSSRQVLNPAEAQQ